MTSIRFQLLQEFAARIDAINGIDGAVRGTTQERDGSAVTALVAPSGEQKAPLTSEDYDCTYNAEVLVTVNIEDADVVIDEGNPYAYLDRVLVLIERVVHDPVEWDTPARLLRIDITGHEVDDPSDDNELSALLYVTFTYRHHFQDPES